MRWTLSLGLLVMACASSEGSAPVPGTASGGTSGAGGAAGSAGGTSSDAGADAPIDLDGSAADPFCSCSPGLHTERIIVLSDDNELWSYEPLGDTFEQIGRVPCAGSQRPFSLAVDPGGNAWVVFVESHDLMTVNLADPSSCADPGFTPDQQGLGVFGMSFATTTPGDGCARLYAHSYSGTGPFSEGPGLGQLARITPQTGDIETLSPIDYNGGELAGTGDGRLFAFAGTEPAKLIEYNRETGAVLDTVPLPGLDKTNASAFAFFGGDVFFFTEALPEACEPCMVASCQPDYQACQDDALCAADLECALQAGDVSDDCGGSVPQGLIDCVYGTCLSQCDPPFRERVSQVTRLDHDKSDSPNPTLELVHAFAPIRIVGAGSSTCVPVAPPK